MRAFICVVFALLLAGCQRNPAAQPAKEYQMQGEVVALDPAAHLATVKAGKIEGWMEAMTMEFPVKDPAEFAKLSVGDQILAKLQVNDIEYYLVHIQVIAKAPAK